MTHTFLLEIGLEEMPANVVLSAETQLADKMKGFLDDKNLSFEKVKSYSTPRRLAVMVEGLADKQADENLVVRGPARKIAQDEEGNWTKAAIGFSKGQGGTVEDLIFKDENGEEYVYMEKFISGKPTQELLKDLDEVITNIEFPKNMKWGNYSYQYIRPIHWVVSVLDDEVVPFNVFDVSSGNKTDGHRFLGEPIEINHPSEYEEKLKNQYVIPNRSERKEMIMEQIKDICKENDWLVPASYGQLLEEVTDLVEYPTAFYGEFDESYLSVPDVVLKTAMVDHQRYFPVQSAKEPHALLPYFISVRNGNEEHLANVVKGNERVIEPRFADAKFFYEEDQQTSIDEFVEKLKAVEYYDQLGSLYDKQVRAENMVGVITAYFDLSGDEVTDLLRVTTIYKFDLMTQVVMEFTSLQGTIGELYTAERNENKAVSKAIGEQYMPLSGTDSLPETKLGKFTALIDKLDSLIQFFSIGQIPTGSNDPYALRRQAIGVVRLILNLQDETINIDELINDLVKVSVSSDIPNDALVENMNQLVQFLGDRLEQIMQTEYNIPHDIRQAALSATSKNLQVVLANSLILNEVKTQENFKEIVEQITRVINMTKNEKSSGAVNADLFETSSERELAEEVKHLEEVFEATEDANKRFEALEEISPFISDFFEHNMIMVDDEAVKANRLSLLNKIATIAQEFADFSQLVI